MVNLNPIKSYSLQEIEGLEAVKKKAYGNNQIQNVGPSTRCVDFKTQCHFFLNVGRLF